MPERAAQAENACTQHQRDDCASINEREEKLRGIAKAASALRTPWRTEMKTPLTSILGFADILRIKSVVTDEQRRDFASAIVEEAKRLRELSAKLLTLASTDNTPLDFARIFPRHNFLRSAHATMAPVLGRRGIR